MKCSQIIHYSVYELLATAPEFHEYFLDIGLHDTCVMSGQVFIGRKNIRLSGLQEFDVGDQN